MQQHGSRVVSSRDRVRGDDDTVVLVRDIENACWERCVRDGSQAEPNDGERQRFIDEHIDVIVAIAVAARERSASRVAATVNRLTSPVS
jgi:hypothetical protein